jgi:hypothetical protein
LQRSRYMWQPSASRDLDLLRVAVKLSVVTLLLWECSRVRIEILCANDDIHARGQRVAIAAHLDGVMSVTMQAEAGSGDDRIIDPMIELARCSPQHRIVVAGVRSIELALALQGRGYARASSTANCGHPAGQYDVALVDWRQRTFKMLEKTLDWLTGFLRPAGVLVVWMDPHKPSAREELRSALERRGFVVESGTVRDDGSAVSARRYQALPMSLAA